MGPRADTELEWAGIDLHVHTPASNDYKGSREDTEYLEIIRRANAPDAVAGVGIEQELRETPDKRIGCIAFTDHNSVEGFRRYYDLHRKTQEHHEFLSSRDAGNPFLTRLGDELKILRSVRILMGVEISAHPGIHLLVIFDESVKPESAIQFLEQIYESPYEELKGNPAPITRQTLDRILDTIVEHFQGKAIVVAPHVDSDRGLYKGLKDYGQARIAALKHPALKAISFNKSETRERIRNLFTQPDYRRRDVVAFIQSSDFHGDPGTVVGQPRTEVFVPRGKATFRNITEAFRIKDRVKCSVDFTQEEYVSLTKGRHVESFSSEPGTLRFREADFNRIAEITSGLLNTIEGVLDLEGTISSEQVRSECVTELRNQLASILKEKVQPRVRALLFRDLHFSHAKVRVLIRVFPSPYLHTCDGSVFVSRDGQTRKALPHEIESVVSRKLNRRFGRRLEDTFEDVRTKSTLLAKFSRGIPLLLLAQQKLRQYLPNDIEVVRVEPTHTRSREAAEAVFDLYDSLSDEFPFGNPNGNTTILSSLPPDRPRLEDQYMRFTVFRADVQQDIQEKFAWGKLEEPTIVIRSGGCIGLIEPGFLISDTAVVLLKLKGDWQHRAHSLLAWMKSSFFLWYCAVRLADINLYKELVAVTPLEFLGVSPRQVILPRETYGDFYRSLDQSSQNLILEEKKFMKEINRLVAKGGLDTQQQDKLRERHNAKADGMCLALDKEVYRFLGLSKDETEFIANTIRELRLTDFGFLTESKSSKGQKAAH